MNIKKHIPNSITCLNLVCGVLGIILAWQDMRFSSILIFLACVLDFLDGFAARLLKVSSPIGKELDSLADAVTFGVLPGIIVWHLYLLSGPASQLSPYLIYLSILIPVFSALRLAKFNIDTRQSSSFLGLPTPANAIFFASLPLLLDNEIYHPYILNEITLSSLCILSSAALVSEMPLFAFKFKNYSLKNNIFKYLFLFISLLLLISITYTAIPLIIILYIFFSLVEHFSKKN